MQTDRPPILEIRGLRKSIPRRPRCCAGSTSPCCRRSWSSSSGRRDRARARLLRCCNRLEEPTAGSISIDGIDIMARATDINAMRRQIGMVFQSFNLYPHMTALRKRHACAAARCCASRGPKRSEIGLAALDRVGLADKARSYPGELSGGQQQRVAIARALALEPKVMLFDEPTSALDPELVGSVLNVMRELKRSGMTMLVVSHEMRFARDAADRVIFMDHGGIVEEGPPQQIFSRARRGRARAPSSPSCVR